MDDEMPLDTLPLVGHEPGTGLRGSNQSGMRAYNERLLLSLVRQKGSLAKSEIARITGLSAQTVSVIIRALEHEGLLIRNEPVRGKIGQPSVPMSLNPDGAFFFGLKIGRRSAELILTDFLGAVRDRRRLVYRYPVPAAIVRFVNSSISTISAALPAVAIARINGMGIAMPFQFWDWAAAIGVPASEMDAWKTTDIRADIAQSYPFPVLIENDATSACSAELVFGTTAPARSFLYFYIAFFIGGGLVLDGAVYSGRSGNAGALGSMPVITPDGHAAQLIETSSLVTLERAMIAAGVQTDFLWESIENWDIDPVILQNFIDLASTGIAQAIVSALAVIDFEAVMIDGWLPANLRDRLVQATAQKITTMNTSGLELPRLVPGTVGPDARALGAASLPLSERFLIDQSFMQKTVTPT